MKRAAGDRKNSAGWPANLRPERLQKVLDPDVEDDSDEIGGRYSKEFFGFSTDVPTSWPAYSPASTAARLAR